IQDSKHYFQSEQKLSKSTRARSFHLQILAAALVVFVAIWAGNAAASGELLPAYIAAFTLVTLPIIESLLPVSEAVERIPTYVDSFQRIERIKQYLPAEQNKQEALVLGDNFPLQLKDVSYRYAPEDQ